jgi:hypothetical protein
VNTLNGLNMIFFQKRRGMDDQENHQELSNYEKLCSIEYIKLVQANAWGKPTRDIKGLALPIMSRALFR